MPRIVPAVLVLIAFAASASSWAAADGPRAAATAADPRLTAEPLAVAPGATIVLRGRGFPRNADIVLRAGPPHSEAVRIGSARTGRRGAFTAPIRIRLRASPGRFVALACHEGCTVKASTAFRIVAH
ncbi:MAG TPA: hypothetical protein VK506_02145 [Conexibacter sp.]|nr:hypothetical protein [Conexibacter sp.]